MKSNEFLKEANMSRAAKGHEKYGKEGMEALAKAGREGAGEKELDRIRAKHDKYDESIDEATQRLDPKCWKGYRKQGTKMKGDVRVNNCVKVSEESNDEYDDEAGMVDSNLETIKRAAEELDQVLGQDDNMAEWAQEKLAVVKSMIVAVKDYVVSQKSTGIDPQVDEEFNMIESVIESLAVRNQVDAEVIWEDLESLTEDELYVFAVTQETVNEDWQKVNKKDKTDGMSKKAVNAYRRENPGSKLKTAVTTKPSKLKKGSKASKRRKSYCSRSKGQMNMHNISCAKTPDKAICKARRRWNC